VKASTTGLETVGSLLRPEKVDLTVNSPIPPPKETATTGNGIMKKSFELGLNKIAKAFEERAVQLYK